MPSITRRSKSRQMGSTQRPRRAVKAMGAMIAIAGATAAAVALLARRSRH
ncbi:hypothetical protein [Actinopolymorpha alba]|nr:hypothetical protein [Actinopolymorpha alba]